MTNRDSDSTLTNVTFSGNSAGNLGESISNGVSGNLLVRNSIFWGHRGLLISGGTSTISDSLVQGGCPEDATCTHRLVNDNPNFMRLGKPKKINLPKIKEGGGG